MSKQTFTTSNSMALEQPRGALGKVSTVFATKLKSFTFLPILKKLPAERRVISAWEKGSVRPQASGDAEASEGSMTDQAVYKAEIVYVTDSEDTEPQETSKDPQIQLKSTDNSALTPSPIPAMAQVEIRCPSPRLIAVEPTDNKQSDISRLGCHNTFEGAEVSSGQFLNSEPQREEEVLSQASSVDLFPSIASSKESILSEGWDQDRSWSALQMLSPYDSPVPFSGTVSPCSSVRSGAFTPSVLRIKRHTLAPGSSLAQMPGSSGQTVCCDRQAPSPCPLSSRVRHRPPPTHLSLLTAILRKGRLPILSPALQRPYSPCWPISPTSMSSCKACSAASTIAPMESTKDCASKGMACTEPSHNARPKSPRIIYNTPSMSFKKHNKVSISSAPDSRSSALSRVTPSPEDSSSMTLPSSSPSEHAPGHLSKPVSKEILAPRVPSSLLFSSFSSSRSLSPKSSHLSCCRSESQTPSSESCAHPAAPAAEHLKGSYNILDPPSRGHGQKSKEPSPVLKKAELSSDFKPRWMPHDPSPIPDLKSAQQSMPHDPSPIPDFISGQQSMPRDPSPIPDLKPAQQSKDILASAILKQAEDNPRSYLQNGKKAILDLERVLSASPALKLSPSPGPVGLTRLACTPDISDASPRPSLRSPTPDHYTLSPSPVIPSRQLSPSPSYSLCSSPSPSLRDGTPDSTDRGGKSRKPYKIKSTYKALAAIPTNILLQEQQAIDDEVEKNESLDPGDNFAWEDPHSEMCTPAQLRQQSAELYAAIDEVLENTNPTHQSSPADKPAVKSAASEAPRKLTSSPSPRLLGRETKYAHHQVPGPSERTLTKPGVIRPATVTSRLDDVRGEENLPNPFQRHQDSVSNRYQYKFASNTSSTVDKADGRAASGRESAQRETFPSEKPRHSASSPAFLIAPTMNSAPPLREGSLQGLPTSLKPIQVKMETPETHI
ncbi:muscular LMNA-interacting protein [Colossoma macropomum]|uniref:muscular LMNA-interacting protein n=1 Tax=Colossoma macropomum TaxID=42526 RepID=UPI001863B63C|nr:muscular LMNA-interacting protein [Colossoma macropomum]